MLLSRHLCVFLSHLSAAVSSSQYLSGLHKASASVEQHLKEHSIKLTNLRTLSHHLRSSLLPELEGDLAALQRELARAGTYSGPVSAPPSLIPPTPFRSNQPNTSLAVPQTPAMHAAQARVQFTPSNQAGPLTSHRAKSTERSVREPHNYRWCALV